MNRSGIVPTPDNRRRPCASLNPSMGRQAPPDKEISMKHFQGKIAALLALTGTLSMAGAQAGTFPDYGFAPPKSSYPSAFFRLSQDYPTVAPGPTSMPSFFKHLPGIFTGIGIIGTFFGLITGLSSFQVSESPSTVRASLEALLHGVHEAFYVSAGAIFLAMLVTVIEKLFLTSLHRKVERLSQRIDALYEAGAGEEYLSRLVRASEDSSSQTRILKDALVTDLKQILTELTDKQIAAATANNNQLAEQIVSNLHSGLKVPLDAIATAVNQVGQDQGSAVNRLLTDVLSGFSQRLQDLFGGQISGINELQQQTIQALQATVGRMEQMANNMEAAGKKTTDLMADRMVDAIAGIESRQKQLSEGLADFIAQMKASAEQSQTSTSVQLQTMLTNLGDQVGAMVAALQTRSEASSQMHATKLSQIADQTGSSISEINAQVQNLVSAVSEAMAGTQRAVVSFQSATTDAITRLNSSAETLYLAANEFAKAGDGVKGTLEATSGVAGQLSQAAGAVTSAMRSLDTTVADYKASRDSVTSMVEQLNSVVEVCRREASLTENVLNRIESATAGLIRAQQEADDYMKSISEVIGAGFDEFSQNMTKVVGEANTEFYQQLSRATKLLREGIEELESTVSAIPMRQAR